MILSYAITVCTEGVEIERLLSQLLVHIRPQDEVVILFDSAHGTDEVWKYLDPLHRAGKIKLYKEAFKGHFADWKNLLTSYCSGDFIFNIDADEYPDHVLLHSLPTILERNPEVDVLLTPRVNTVKGLTSEYVRKWGWFVDSENRVNWPDYQWRIYRNTPDIKWINKVHERLEGFKKWTKLPESKFYALYHPKDLQKQIQQNNYYNTLQ